MKLYSPPTTTAAKPECLKASLIFQHGNYTLAKNGSIIMTTIPGDGRMLISDSCGKSAAVIKYDDTLVMKVCEATAYIWDGLRD